MRKHLFRMVSQSSSNTITSYNWIGKNMKKLALLVLGVMTVASYLGSLLLSRICLGSANYRGIAIGGQTR
jgi:hypothetical protein